jgi:hypothetical protein
MPASCDKEDRKESGLGPFRKGIELSDIDNSDMGLPDALTPASLRAHRAAQDCAENEVGGQLGMMRLVNDSPYLSMRRAILSIWATSTPIPIMRIELGSIPQKIEYPQMKINPARGHNPILHRCPIAVYGRNA